MSRRVFIAFAWLLAGLWLPATLHCAAGTAGWFDSTDCCAGEASEAPDAALDHCATLESGVPRDELNTAALSAPIVALLAILRPVLVADPAAADGATPWRAAPPEIGGLWRAVERVVAPARAP